MKKCILFISICFMSLSPIQVIADSIGDALNAVGDAAGSIGESVQDTAGAIGKSVDNTVESVRGNRTPEMVRKEVDIEEQQSLTRLFKDKPGARKLYNESYGYAVFDSNKKGLMFSSASGVGVAVRKPSSERTYMRMASLGASIGGGIQYYKIVFLFQDKDSFDGFVNSGWEAKGESDAVMGKDSIAAGLRFVSGKAIFILNDTGIMLGANVSGTKYWKDSALNGQG